MKHRHTWAVIGASIGVLAGGVLIMIVLAALREPPAEIEDRERTLSVLAREVYPDEYPVTITGFGEARVRSTVEVTPEVAGRVVEVHPNLDVGGVIPAGETLFVVDPRDYASAVDELEASVAQIRTGLQRIRTQMTNDQERLRNLERNRDLARAEYERLKSLFEEDQVGTRSGVEQAEQAYNMAQDQVDQLKRLLALYPIELEEAQSSLRSAQARLDRARRDMERTEITAPFDARIKRRNVEKDQMVSAAAPALTIADDSLLEITVPLDSRDVRRWIQFSQRDAERPGAWFAHPERVPVEVTWTEDRDDHVWMGTLHRVEQFSEPTRTVEVTVRVEGDDALSLGDGLPLVEGMFCEVHIPGKPMVDVYELPRWAVSFENTVYVANNQRLHIRPVEVVRTEGNSVFVAGGLEPGDKVITTRLVDPLEGTLLDIQLEDYDAGELE